MARVSLSTVCVALLFLFSEFQREFTKWGPPFYSATLKKGITRGRALLPEAQGHLWHGQSAPLQGPDGPRVTTPDDSMEAPKGPL